jgi:GH24 family phage-related lysozyme (muramidase)
MKIFLALALAAWPALGAAAQASPATTTPPTLPASPLRRPVLNFDISGTKFSLDSLMRVLKDSNHEGWVLAAYPDPKTSRPLIGAGFSLDVEASEHVQSDPLNPNDFLEPSSAQLWQAAGLDPERLQKILDQFDRNLAKWNKKNYRKKIRAHQLPPQLTEAEAMQLLRVSALQATHNAKAYCRDYAQLTAAQQMALSQLVFQMGVNLEEFVQFLAVLNDGPMVENVVLADNTADIPAEHWQAVQETLMDSQWARRYVTRAITVIAMFDPTYQQNPRAAEMRIQAVLRPPAKHKSKKSHAPPSHTAHSGESEHKSLSTSPAGTKRFVESMGRLHYPTESWVGGVKPEGDDSVGGIRASSIA